MDNLRIYEVEPEYINYLQRFAEHLFQNKKPEQKNTRKYIGVVLTIHDMNYFAPLSSFKPKHIKMKEGLDFLKIKDYAVINLNNMFPIPNGQYTYVDISVEQDIQYRALLLAEYREIRRIQTKIRKNAAALYQHKIKIGNASPLAKRCNDFLLLEKACKDFEQHK